MNEVQERFAQALQYVIDAGFAKNESAVAKTLGVTAPFLNMAKNGFRSPSWGLLLDFCDHYPISFWWLRNGEGDMIGNGDRVIALLQKIREIEG